MAKKKKNPAAVAMGKLSAAKRAPDEIAAARRKGGKAGGIARAAKLTPEQRKASSEKAIRMRWRKGRKRK